MYITTEVDTYVSLDVTECSTASMEVSISYDSVSFDGFIEGEACISVEDHVISPCDLEGVTPEDLKEIAEYHGLPYGQSVEDIATYDLMVELAKRKCSFDTLLELRIGVAVRQAQEVWQ